MFDMALTDTCRMGALTAWTAVYTRPATTSFSVRGTAYDAGLDATCSTYGWPCQQKPEPVQAKPALATPRTGLWQSDKGRRK